MTHIVIVGATSTIAEQCARRWIEETSGNSMVLVGRHAERLAAIASDLKVRDPHSTIRTQITDFVDPTSIQQCVDAICHERVPDIVLIAHGMLPDQKMCQTNLSLVKETIEINALSPILFAESFASYLEKKGSGHLAIIGSVAGDRGRQSNYVYGSAKGLVERYTEGLWHRFALTAVRITLIKPGPTDTPMTIAFKTKGVTLANPFDVARDIVQGIAKRKPTIYTPHKWRFIMTIIRHMPNFILAKLRI